jgi:hypothetical protein
MSACSPSPFRPPEGGWLGCNCMAFILQVRSPLSPVQWRKGGRGGSGRRPHAVGKRCPCRPPGATSGQRCPWEERLLLDVAGAGHFAGGDGCACASASSTEDWPASAAEKSWPTVVPMTLEFRDGDELHADIGHRLDGRVLGSAALIESSVILAKGAAFLVLRVLIERGARARGRRWPSPPSRRPARCSPCSVAHEMKASSAASAFCEPAGTARFQAHSQLPRLPRPVDREPAKPTLSATCDSFGLETKEAATVASIHMPHLPAGTAPGSR